MTLALLAGAALSSCVAFVAPAPAPESSPLLVPMLPPDLRPPTFLFFLA